MIRVILTDIEGTTSSIAFVKEVLFPYAEKHLPEFLRSRAGQPGVAALLQDIYRESGRDLTLEETLALLQQWMRADKKHTALKALQGMIWEQGYADGDLQGHIYADAAAALQDWHARSYQLCIYSSGSVAAQKLLFAHTRYGDLTPLFSAFFDTRIGNKLQVDSYTAIAGQLELAPEDILFLSDIGAELDAAAAAGMQTRQLLRPEDGTTPAAGHAQAGSFAEIDPAVIG